jgi:membrane protease YdiL (CAAX protease family)
MKGFLKFIAVFFGILLISAVLAPFLYTLLPYKFERIFNRLVMIFSLAALWFFLIGKKFSAKDYGLQWAGPDSRFYLAAGFLTGLSVLAVFSLVKVGVGQADWLRPEGVELLAKLLSALGAGFLIAFIEEFFFRGFIYRTLCKWRWPLVLSVIATSAFYAIIHFVSFEKPFVDSTPSIVDGLRLVAAPFLSLLQFSRYWPEALGLFLFGIVLNHAAIKSGSLYPSIGLHAGCVLYVKADSLFLTFFEKERIIYASGKFYDGLVGWAFLILMGVVLSILIQARQAAVREGKHG